MRSLLVLIFACFGTGLAYAQTGKRVALLIGNSNYTSAHPLSNPSNDIRLISGSAHKAGFQVVLVEQDLSVRKFQKILRDFRKQADGAAVAMVYYAGHGMESRGMNWLIPTDAELASERDLPYEAINLNQVMEAIEGASMRLLILDACRDNPFGRSWRGGLRAINRGLGDIKADDVMIIYAAAPGQVAQDGDSGNSPFAKALANRLTEPGLPIQMLGGAVRDDVLTATGGSQRPYVSASVSSIPFYLVQAKSVNAVNTVPVSTVLVPAPATVLVDPVALDLALWQGALAAGTVPAYQDYLQNSPRGMFRVQAEQNIITLKNNKAGATLKPSYKEEVTPAKGVNTMPSATHSPLPGYTQSTPPMSSPQQALGGAPILRQTTEKYDDRDILCTKCMASKMSCKRMREFEDLSDKWFARFLRHPDYEPARVNYRKYDRLYNEMMTKCDDDCAADCR